MPDAEDMVVTKTDGAPALMDHIFQSEENETCQCMTKISLDGERGSVEPWIQAGSLGYDC